MARSQRLMLLMPVCVAALGATTALGTGCGGDDVSSTPPDGGVDGSTHDGGVSDAPATTEGSTPDAPTTSATLTQISKSGAFLAIFDAVPDPTGATVYFTGIDSSGNIGVFSVAVGSAPAAATTVSSGGAFVAPLGIATSSDGKTIYVADPGVSTSAGDLGAILSVPSTGGA